MTIQFLSHSIYSYLMNNHNHIHLLTRLNCSRLHEILPKNLISSSFCAYTIMIKSIRCNCLSFITKCQSILLTSFPIASYASVYLWENSQVTKTNINAQIPQKIDSNSNIESISLDDCKEIEWDVFVSNFK